MAHPIITLLPWVPPLVPHIIPPRYITPELTMKLLKNPYHRTSSRQVQRIALKQKTSRWASVASIRKARTQKHNRIKKITMYRQHCQTLSIKRVSASQAPHEMNKSSNLKRPSTQLYNLPPSALVLISSLLFLSVFLLSLGLVSCAILDIPSGPRSNLQVPCNCLCAPWVIERILSYIVWPLPFMQL